jgi:hypothetical protein
MNGETLTTGGTSNTVWMTTNAKPSAMRDATPTIPRSSRDRPCPMGTLAQHLSHRTGRRESVHRVQGTAWTLADLAARTSVRPFVRPFDGVRGQSLMHEMLCDIAEQT